MKKILIKAIALFMTLVMLTDAVPANAIAAKDIFDPPLKIGVISDPHYFPESFVNLNSEQYLQDAHCDAKLMGESSAVFRAALETIALRKEKGAFGMEYLLIPGDLTFNGEKPGHTEVAGLLRNFEARTGIEVFVINGNHDINNNSAATYATPGNRKVDARENPGLLYTTPQFFRSTYADFGYSQADSFYTEDEVKAGMLSYAASLRGGYRLIAIDSCTYTPDVSSSGRSSVMRISPGLLEWILEEMQAAESRGETIIGMAHGTIVEHFDLEKIVSKNSTVIDNERISYELADAGMHFVFTGHLHSNDISRTVSANNETIFDIETGALCSYPNTYREVSFAKTLVQGHVTCRLDNIDCDDKVLIDVSGVSEKYGVIEKPFRENYCMPVLHGGSIEQGIRNNPLKYFENAHLLRATDALHQALPSGIAGFLRDKGINIGEEITKSSPAFRSALRGYNLTPEAFSQFLGAVVARLDDKYINNNEHTEELILAFVGRFSDFEIVEGNPDTAFGKVALLAFEYNAAGNENPGNNPEITASVNALRTQKGADRVVYELLDMIVNDVLMDEILPSVSLNELDMLLPADLMLKLRSVAGDNLSVGGVLDTLFGSAADKLNKIPFFSVGGSRGLIMATVYSAGLYFINAQGRLKIGNALADMIESFSTDESPSKLGDFNTTLEYKGKVTVVPTAENYRLPADITLAAGTGKGDVVIKWNTMLGIEGTDIEISPLPAGAVITRTSERIDQAVPAIDFGFFALNKPCPLVSHTVTVTGLDTGLSYTFRAGDSTRGLMSGTESFSISNNGKIQQNAKDLNRFFVKLIAVFEQVLNVFQSVGTIAEYLTAV